MDASDEHKCDDFGHGQDVSDKDAWDNETGEEKAVGSGNSQTRRISLLRQRKRGRGRLHKAATNTERTRPLLSEDYSSSAENEPRTKHQCW